MTRWTNGRYRSTMHRVLKNATPFDRYSAAFFNEGNLNCKIECLPSCVQDCETPKYPPVTVEQHMTERSAWSYRSRPKSAMVS